MNAAHPCTEACPFEDDADHVCNYDLTCCKPVEAITLEIQNGVIGQTNTL